jgi:hypothetical protein
MSTIGGLARILEMSVEPNAIETISARPKERPSKDT